MTPWIRGRYGWRHGVKVRVMFERNDLLVIAASAVLLFGLLWWGFEWTVLSALVLTAAYSVLVLRVIYNNSKGSS